MGFRNSSVLNHLDIRSPAGIYSALALFRDANGNAYFGIDNHGHPSLGSRYEFRENWMWGLQTSIAAGALTNSVLTNSASVWLANAGANASGGFVNQTGVASNTAIATGATIFVSTNALNNWISLKMGNNVINHQTNFHNLYLIAEVPVIVSNGNNPNNVEYRVGLAHNDLTQATNPAHPGGYYFRKLSSDTYWQCITDDLTTSFNATIPGVNVAASTNMQMMRIEFYGSSTFTGANRVKFYIDNTLVGSSTSNIYSASNVFFSFGMNTNGSAPAASINMAIGPLLLMYNMPSTPLVP